MITAWRGKKKVILSTVAEAMCYSKTMYEDDSNCPIGFRFYKCSLCVGYHLTKKSKKKNKKIKRYFICSQTNLELCTPGKNSISKLSKKKNTKGILMYG